MMGLVDDIGMDLEKMRLALATRWSFIHDFDLERHKSDALETLKLVQV